MKLLLFFILITISQAAFSQEPEKVKKLHIGINGSPELCYRTLKRIGIFVSNNDEASFRNGSELPGPGYTLGVNLRYDLGKIFFIGTGLNYTERGYKKMGSPLLISSSAVVRRSIIRYTFVEAPVNIGVRLGNKKTKLFFLTGFNTHFSISAAEYFQGAGRKSNPNGLFLHIVNPTTFSLFGQFGLEQNFQKNFRITIGPSLQHQISPIEENRVVHDYLWNMGFGFTVSKGICGK